MSSNPAMTIGQLAGAAGVHVETIRYYQRRQLLPLPARPLGGIRRYSGTDLARLRFIKAAQRLGFTLEEVNQLLQLEDGTGCAQAQTLGQQRLQEIRQRIVDLQQMEKALATMLAACNQRTSTHQTAVRCPLIEALQQAENTDEA